MKRLHFIILALCLFTMASAFAQQTHDCTTSCTIVSDAFPPPPAQQPTSCTLKDGTTTLNVATVAGPAGAVFCSHTIQLTDGRAVSLTATATYASGTSAPSAPPLVFTSKAPVVNPPQAFGETAILTQDDNGNAGLLLAQNATLSATGTLVSLSFYVTTTGGNLILGVYDATGPSGGPGKKVAETASFVPVAGWNTKAVLSPVALNPGTYWLAYAPSSNALGFRKDTTAGVSGKLYARAFGTMPATFATTGVSSTSSHWSLYGTLQSAPAMNAPANLRTTP